MNIILIKLFATALTLSQVTTRPDAVKTQFDPVADKAQVVQILRDGCAHMRKAFDIEDINLDELISTAMEDPSAVAGASAPKILHGLNLDELNTSYKQFCKGENPASSPFDAAAVIAFYNKAAADLPSAESLRDIKLPGASLILDNAGKPFSETFEANGRRLSVPIESVPPLVRKAFIAAEDKRFESHHGIDERGVPARAEITVAVVVAVLVVLGLAGLRDGERLGMGGRNEQPGTGDLRGDCALTHADKVRRAERRIPRNGILCVLFAGAYSAMSATVAPYAAMSASASTIAL